MVNNLTTESPGEPEAIKESESSKISRTIWQCSEIWSKRMETRDGDERVVHGALADVGEEVAVERRRQPSSPAASARAEPPPPPPAEEWREHMRRTRHASWTLEFRSSARPGAAARQAAERRGTQRTPGGRRRSGESRWSARSRPGFCERPRYLQNTRNYLHIPPSFRSRLLRARLPFSS